MYKICRGIFCGISFFGIVLTNIHAEPVKNANDYHRTAHTNKIVVDQAMEINIDHNGVTLDTLTFSGNEALLVTWNRSPHRVNGSLALCLFDKKNILVAAATKLRARIGSGKQASFRFDFGKFVANFNEVARYQLVHVISGK